jgi:hypothetical protein
MKKSVHKSGSKSNASVPSPLPVQPAGEQQEGRELVYGAMEEAVMNDGTPYLSEDGKRRYIYAALDVFRGNMYIIAGCIISILVFD